MEINEQGNYELNRESEHDKFAELKEQITADVKAELASLGATIIPAHYEGAKDIAALVDKATGLKAEYEVERDRITQRYSKEVAASKLSVLEMDHKLDMADLVADIEKVAAKDAKYRAEAIKEAQASDEYRAAKRESLQTLALLRQAGVNDIPQDIMMNVLRASVEAKDQATIRLMQVIVGEDTVAGYMCDSATRDIAAYKENVELQNFIGAAKNWLTTGKDELTLHLMMARYGGK